MLELRGRQAQLMEDLKSLEAGVVSEDRRSQSLPTRARFSDLHFGALQKRERLNLLSSIRVRQYIKYAVTMKAFVVECPLANFVLRPWKAASNYWKFRDVCDECKAGAIAEKDVSRGRTIELIGVVQL